MTRARKRFTIYRRLFEADRRAHDAKLRVLLARREELLVMIAALEGSQ